ncbi:MAG: helix-turn-helix domain-containing protein [Candidatus Izemoplasmatales bacterium]|nr:helix-turn-helix domain-containing protein [Candidatus Izemoplasmatales bacterium]
MNELIRSKRREMNLTQQELADLLFVSPKTISKWETGRGMPEVGMIAKIASVLSLSADQMLGSISEQSTTAEDVFPEKRRRATLVSISIMLSGIALMAVGMALLKSRSDSFLVWFVLGGLLMVFSITSFFVLESSAISTMSSRQRSDIASGRMKMLILWYVIALLAPILYLFLGDTEAYDVEEIYLASAMIAAAITIVFVLGALLLRIKK